MRIAVPLESAAGEHRVALTPDSAGRLVKGGHDVRIQAGAGTRAGFPDSAYESVGATVVDGASLYADVALVCRVQPPTPADVARLPEGCTLLALLAPSRNGPLLATLASRNVTALALEQVPRITRAQSMDVLSSQSTVAGYKAVLVGASALPKFLPMLTTAAGNVSPARVFVIGAGVAGLQAIATARRLGGVVSAFDVRPAAREQVQSLGATFVAAELVGADAQTAGGYARAQSDDEARRTRDALAAHLKEVDLVITTAQIPGRPAPRLVTAEMVTHMRPGAVIIDLAAESGGNCELTIAGETVRSGSVTILGPVDLPATVPYHASQMFGKNVLALVTHLSHEGALHLDRNDEITSAMTVVRDGQVVVPHPK
ncbi:MAG: Re/Si-specific NAD(P)(+) transhydrogenase subunit alpha [Gemmatimonadaceae bacterium]|nr:Re/Si-specific NAD(P)(+) transhydrogenase subunit alpha [Gemmatimonadaceae bacterium]NUO93024.1 Re/Si-specific NAD(P)(+) transhydrogenase subunit alpha [Gemmatimonadaceae bacterium]NUP56224.1 Re/Si-specific NAD(P)(+) transhydrogenase subunit alpha [Gemmatimonadaceae bacterium]NUP70686.1 Re/Si-specific NAD(P)(+) transhydrogenase subunit alpha [Gemmatimonadaceae bacterium]NUR34090.1 Re/Si-specific NAD(P)(+) transhydrogenase subunit alpha [Gemmatimonadaceae bacterium]